jgi:hypothetical protein
MLAPPRELLLRALLAPPADPPKPPPLVRDDDDGTLRDPTRSPPADDERLALLGLALAPERFAPALPEPVRFAPALLVPARLAPPSRVEPPNLLAVFVLEYGAPPR